MTNPSPESAPLPYRIAVLCDLRDEHGRVLLLRRKKAPNQGLCSPIGGKLDLDTGESPTACAQREILEEAGIHVPMERIRLVGMISERAFERSGHWLIFWFRVLDPVVVPAQTIREGELEWHDPADIGSLPLPDTDRTIIWPVVRSHESPDGHTGFFALHIDCSTDRLTWSLEQSIPPR